MGWLSDVIGVVAAPYTGGASLKWSAKKRQKKKDEEGEEMRAERQRLLSTGLAQGRAMGERVFGQTQEQTGADVQDVIKRRRERLSAPSKAAESVRRSGQQQSRYAASKGGSEAQRKNTGYQAALIAGAQEDKDYEDRLANFQSLIGNIAGTQSALELGGGQLGLASQYIPPAKKGKFLGIF